MTNPQRSTSVRAERRIPSTRFEVQRPWIRRVAMLSVVALSAMLGVVGFGSTAAFALPPIAPVPLGLASSFAVLTPAAVGNTATGPVTTLHGDLGAGGGTTGFPPGVYTGALFTGADADPALADLTIAYADAVGRPAGLLLAPDLLDVTVGPGVHTNSGAVANTGTFTIDAGGDPNAVFIFQVGGALAMAAGSQVVLAGQAKASNVFWAVNGAGAIGASATFAGTLMATAAIAVGAGSTFNGRALSKAGAITMNSNQIYSGPPTVTIDPGPAAVTTDTTPTLTGTTSLRAPATVTVTINGETLHPVPNPVGVWSATPVGLLANGTYTVTASVVDGPNSGSITQQLTVDTLPPEIAITGGVSVGTNDVTPRFAGTSDVSPLSLVTFTFTSAVSGSPVNTVYALVQDNHTWNISPDGFAAGQWTVTASVTDLAGNSTTATQQVTIQTDGPSASITSSALTTDSTPTITGTADVSADTITVSIGDVDVTPVTRTDSTWSAIWTGAPLGDGPHVVHVVATDASFPNHTDVLQTLMIDTIAPVVAIVPGPTDLTNDRTPTISGSTNAPAGSRVSVTIAAGSPLIAFVQSDGTWNATPSVQVAQGVVTVTASVADLAGNIGTYSQSLTIDVSAPVVSINGGPTRTTADATPTIDGDVTGADPGSTVNVTVAGQALTTTVTSSLTWTVTAATVANGAQVVFVTVANGAGNVGNANQSLTVNAIVPAVTITGGPNATTTDATPAIAGSSSAATGSGVVVTVDGQTLNATVQPGGSWVVTAAPITNSTVTVIATITDLDGNVGSATQQLSVNTAGFATITISGGAVRATNDATPTISGTTDAANGRIVTVSVAGQTMSPVVAAGKWSTTAVNISDGIYTLTAVLSPTGGSSASASQQLTVDTVAPVVIIPGGGTGTTTDSTPLITGTGAQPGATVTVTVGGETLTTIVGVDGTWSVTPTVPLSPGAHVVTVRIVDLAGNVGTGSQTLTVAAPTEEPPTSTDDFVSVGPKRVFDTRPGMSPAALRQVNKAPIGGPVELRVELTDLADLVPATGVSAVSLNVTATGSTVAGYITVYACGTRELVSSVNFAAGDTVANAVITPVSASGDVCFYANTPTDVIVDVNGWFATGAAFNAVGPKRLFDTRTDSGPDVLVSVPKAKVAADGVLEVPVTDLVGFVPASGVSAVSLNVVVTNPDFAGYVTVYACGSRALVSSVNYVAGATVANAVIAPVSATGTVCFYSLAGVDLVVDINGWFTAGSGFVPAGPARVADTRPGQSPDALRAIPKAVIGGANILELEVTDLAGYVPADGVSAVSLNVTAVNPAGAGYINVFACGAVEEVSSLNFVAGQTVANAVIAPVSASGTICLFSNVATDVIVDINGWIGQAS